MFTLLFTLHAWTYGHDMDMYVYVMEIMMAKRNIFGIRIKFMYT